MKTLRGYDVVRGVIKERTLYPTRKEAAQHVAASAKGKGTRGFIVVSDKVIEVNSVIRGGKWCHQEIGGSGYTRSSYSPPASTYQKAKVALLAKLRSQLKDAKYDVKKFSKLIKVASAKAKP